MKRNSALILQAATVLLGVTVFFLLLWEPHLEGRNAHATTFEIYFNDPFLAYVYVGSIPFFVALHRAFSLFRDARQQGGFSRANLPALRVIRNCALVMIAFVAGGVVFILMFGDGEDRPAGLFMSFLVALASSVMAVAAAIFARRVQNTLTRPEGNF